MSVLGKLGWFTTIHGPGTQGFITAWPDYLAASSSPASLALDLSSTVLLKPCWKQSWLCASNPSPWHWHLLHACSRVVGVLRCGHSWCAIPWTGHELPHPYIRSFPCLATLYHHSDLARSLPCPSKTSHSFLLSWTRLCALNCFLSHQSGQGLGLHTAPHSREAFSARFSAQCGNRWLQNEKYFIGGPRIDSVTLKIVIFENFF